MLLLSFLLAACRPAVQPAPTLTPFLDTPLVEPTALQPTTGSITSTPVVAIPAGGLGPEMTSITPIPPVQVVAADPFRFTFPTAQSNPISSWRPPLYPVPWEPTPNDHFYFTRPIGANDVNWPLARYRYGGMFYAEPHTGIDIPAPKGTPILSTGPGVVTWSGYGLYFLLEEYQDPYGIAVAIQHDFGYQGQQLYSIYAHLDETFVIKGQRVETGDIIGKVGETGRVSGPHLHFEVRVGDNNYLVSRNPELWISPPQGWGVLVGRVMESNGDLIYEQEFGLRHMGINRYYSFVSYGKGAVNSDPYYRENAVIGDLPPGEYEIWTTADGKSFRTYLEIVAGMVTYFSLNGSLGFDFTLPPTPGPRFIPPDLTATPSPLTTIVP